jgi:hypothetical protein
MWYVFLGRYFDGVLLDDGLGYGGEVVVEEEVVCGGGLGEGVDV